MSDRPSDGAAARMAVAYFHAEEALIPAPAAQCYDLVLAVRRYGEWWRRVRCEPLGPEGVLRVGSRFRFSGGPVSWVIEVTGLAPHRAVELRYVEGDLLGPVRWEFEACGTATRVRYVYRGVTPNSPDTEASFASGRSLRLHRDLMQRDAFAGMRRLLAAGTGVDGGDLFEALHTQRAVRRFRSDPIPDAVLREILAAATRAPSARNAQPWAFLAVRDAALKGEIRRLYLAAWRQAQAATARLDADRDISGRPDYAPMMRAVDDLAEHLDAAPLLVLACLDTAQLGLMADPDGRIRAPQSAYASIFPAAQNLMLAARGLGVGSTLTTVFAAAEDELRTLLGIPPRVHVAALIPLGYPTRPFRVTTRKPLAEVAFLDRWGMPLP